MPSRRSALRLRPALLVLAVLALGVSATLVAPVRAAAQTANDLYQKSEHFVAMRDGVRLHTVVYRPLDAGRSYPILMTRTPYSCRPYGEENYPAQIGPSRYVMEAGYIVVCQDVRGRFMSEGSYDNMRPHVPGDAAVDESSDTYDTIEWLLANVEGHNGRVGMWGISYPGFYAAAALPEAHPALVASSPQAPIADFFFDDFLASYWLAFPVFGEQHDGPTTDPWWRTVDPGTRDGYAFFMDLGPWSNAEPYYADNFFWQQVVAHPNYDAFWQSRNILPHLDGIDHAVMVVGGWFDAEDLYGPLNIYRAVEARNPDAFNVLVMGPWSHGDWARNRDVQTVGDVEFGQGISDFYQREIELPFFEHFLKEAGPPPSFEAMVFDTGRKEWTAFEAWPPLEAVSVRWFLRADEGLSRTPPGEGDRGFTEYVSDPNEPVPYTEHIRITFTPRAYMAEDQRFAERRPDVVEFQTEVLEEDVTLAGEILAHLEVSTTGTDADWVVKLIDVYPPDTPDTERTPEHTHLGGYQQMVRSEVMRGRFRNSYERPEPFTPGRVTVVEVPLQDVYHTFRAGHRIMVQVQSTWFPLIDRNPQTFVPNIFEAREEDYVAATHRVYHTPGQPSWLEVRVLP